MESVYDVESGIFSQYLWDNDALRSLIVFKKSCHYSRQCERRAIECVAEMGFLVSTAVTAFQAVRLICLKVGNRGYLKPSSLCRGIDLEVECNRGSKAHISSA